MTRTAAGRRTAGRRFRRKSGPDARRKGQSRSSPAADWGAAGSRSAGPARRARRRAAVKEQRQPLPGESVLVEVVVRRPALGVPTPRREPASAARSGRAGSGRGGRPGTLRPIRRSRSNRGSPDMRHFLVGEDIRRSRRRLIESCSCGGADHEQVDRLRIQPGRDVVLDHSVLEEGEPPGRRRQLHDRRRPRRSARRRGWRSGAARSTSAASRRSDPCGTTRR